MLLDGIMPEFQFGEAYRVSVDALPGRTLEAIKQTTPGEMPLVRLLFQLRSLPALFREEAVCLPPGRKHSSGR